MEEIFQNIDWMELLSAFWTIVLLPVLTRLGTKANAWLEAKKLDKYGAILYDEVVKAVKCVQEAVVKSVKGTDEWDEEKMTEVRELAKDKAIQALSSIVYRTLKEANDDFEEYLDSLVDTALFDIKNGLK